MAALPEARLVLAIPGKTPPITLKMPANMLKNPEGTLNLSIILWSTSLEENLYFTRGQDRSRDSKSKTSEADFSFVRT